MNAGRKSKQASLPPFLPRFTLSHERANETRSQPSFKAAVPRIFHTPLPQKKEHRHVLPYSFPGGLFLLNERARKDFIKVPPPPPVLPHGRRCKPTPPPLLYAVTSPRRPTPSSSSRRHYEQPCTGAAKAEERRGGRPTYQPPRKGGGRERKKNAPRRTGGGDDVSPTPRPPNSLRSNPLEKTGR